VPFLKEIDMGWTFFGIVPTDPKAECDRMLTWSGGGFTHTVLKSRMVGSVYYGAVQRAAEDGTCTVFGAVFLTSRQRGEWGYKDMTESAGPGAHASKCPATILALLTPTENKYANDWRARCRAFAAKKPASRKVGDIVTSGQQYQLLEKLGPRQGWRVLGLSDGKTYRMPAAQLSQAT
jgi:hypothetical protein